VLSFYDIRLWYSFKTIQLKKEKKMNTTIFKPVNFIMCVILVILVGAVGCRVDFSREDKDVFKEGQSGEALIDPDPGSPGDSFDETRASTTPVKVTKNDGLSGPYKIYYSSRQTMHDTWSDGTQVTDSISSIHVYPGWEVIIYRYADYKGEYKVLGENSSSSHYWSLKLLTMSGNLNWNNRVSSMEIRKKIITPAKLEYEKSNPSNSEFGGEVNVNEVQGIAHSAAYWYISNRTRIYRCYINDITDSLGSTHTSSLPSAIDDYDHFGDLAYNDGLVYAPLYKRESSKTAVVVVYNYLLKYQKYAYFPKDYQKTPGWIGINPVNDLIYSTDDYKKLRVYDSNFSSGSTLTYLFTVDLDFGSLGHSDGSWWDNVWNQGGEFGPDGLFYYVLDHKSDEDSGYTGFYIFKITGRKGTALWRANIKYDPDRGDGWKRRCELEGITFWDRGNDSKYPGQIHILFLDLDANEDDCTLMHYSIE
jgi:hypothetical protein